MANIFGQDFEIPFNEVQKSHDFIFYQKCTIALFMSHQTQLYKIVFVVLIVPIFIHNLTFSCSKKDCHIFDKILGPYIFFVTLTHLIKPTNLLMILFLHKQNYLTDLWPLLQKQTFLCLFILSIMFTNQQDICLCLTNSNKIIFSGWCSRNNTTKIIHPSCVL